MAMTCRRRRWLIATVVAVLLIGLGWRLTRPMIDPRFVGKWVDHLYPQYPHFDGYWLFRDDGTGEQKNSGEAPTPICWSVDGEELVVVERGITRCIPIVALDWCRANLRMRFHDFRVRRRVEFPEPNVLQHPGDIDGFSSPFNRYRRVAD